VTLATILSISDFGVLVKEAFRPESPVVSSSESDLGEPLQRFATPAEIQAKAVDCINGRLHNYAFGFWYPSMKGRVLERRIALDPPREGKTFRHSLAGWGIIHLHLYFTPPNTLQCRVAVNSQGRAASRQDRHPELGSASEWDWTVVETLAFRLSRRLASMGRTAPVVQQAVQADVPTSRARRLT
jgi:hypothetical protein